MTAFLGGKLGRQLASLENSESAGLNILAHQENEWVYLMGNAKSRSRESAQDDKWNFCLTAGTLCPANQERP